MNLDDSDFAMEQRLRDALAATADTVQPGGDGLMRIQQRIGEERGRRRWTRPLLALGSVVVIAAVAIGGIAIARHGDDGKAVVNVGHSPGTSTPPASGFPSGAFFPFTTAAEESSWEQSFADGHSPWISDPTAVSEAWVQNYLRQGSDVTESARSVNGDSADVTMSRTVGGADHPVAVVHLVKFGNAWLVTGASAPGGDLTISSPSSGATVTSPLTVSGPGFGVDQRATVELRDAETPTLLGHALTGMFGNGTDQWSASVPFSPSDDGFGVLVVSTASPADGGLGELTAQKVEFDTATPVAAAGAFHGVQGGVIERFAADGTPQGPISGSESHGTVAEVHEVAGNLYFTAGTTNCPSSLYTMASDGGNPTTVANADAGFGITGFDVTSEGRVVYFESGCGGDAGKGKLVFPAFGHGPQGRAVDFPSLPPVVEGDPVWESDGVHVDAFVRTGMEGYLARYDTSKGNNPTPSDNACPGYDVNNGLPGALAVAPDGALWFAVQTGTSMQVLSCAGGSAEPQLTVNGNRTPDSLAVDSAGNVLLADSAGKVWRGTAGGTATELPVQGGVSAVAW